MKLGLVGRVVLILAATVVSVSIIITTVSYRLFSKVLESRFKENLRLTARHLATGASISLLLGDNELLKRLSTTVLRDPAVMGIKVVNRNQKVVMEVGKESKLVVKIPVVMAESEESLVFVPDVEKRLLGHIMIFYTRKPLEKLFKAMLLRIWLLSLVVMAVMTTLSYYFITRAVSEPLKKLMHSVREVGKGNLEVELPKGSLPEIAELSKAFSEMVKDLKSYRELLQETYENLARQKSLASIGRFAFTVAHEIKNPLGIIKGSLDLLKKRELDEKTKGELLNYIEDEVRRMDGLIKDFLELARFKPPNLCNIELEDLIEGICSRLRIKYLDIEVEHRVEVSDKVKSDPEKLERILVNILKNAVEAGAKKIKITVTESNDIWRLELDDNGSGIPEEEREKVFQPFYTTKESGTGLGLAIVMQEVYSMGGKVWIENSSMGGAKFIVVFPKEVENGPDTGGR